VKTYLECLDSNSIRPCDDCAAQEYPEILGFLIGLLGSFGNTGPCYGDGGTEEYMCDTLFGGVHA
jgi:hypothetical protein